MQTLNTFINLIAKTKGRDKFLRLIQYACLHSVDQNSKASIFNLYKQMRMTRKVLRFLRTLQYSSKVREQVPIIKGKFEKGEIVKAILHILNLLENLFAFLYFAADHRVCLSELGVISKESGIVNYPKSMKNYFLQNMIGVIKNIFNLSIIILQGKKQKNPSIAVNAIKKHSFDLIRCLFDCLVAMYYWKGNLPAKKVGILGVITSIMSIMQILQEN